MTNTPKFEDFDLAYTYPWQYGLTLSIRPWTFYSYDDGRPMEKWSWSVRYHGKWIVERGYGDVITREFDGFDSPEAAWADMAENLLPPESYRAAIEVYGDRVTYIDHPVSPDNFMSVAEAAKMLNVSQTRVRQLINNGQLVAHKPRGRWMIERRSVRERIPSLLDLATGKDEPGELKLDE